MDAYPAYSVVLSSDDESYPARRGLSESSIMVLREYSIFPYSEFVPFGIVGTFPEWWEDVCV